MPPIPNKLLSVHLQGLDLLTYGRTARCECGAESRTPAPRLPALSGLKLKRIRRAVMAAAIDVDEQRQEALRRYAKLKTKRGEPVLDDGGAAVLEVDKDGNAIFPTPEARTLFLEEVRALLEATTEIPEVLTVADLVRKERDQNGKVYEVDDIDPDIVDMLGDLLTAPDDAQ